MTAAETRDLHTWFGATHALDGVCVRIEAGRVHALVGENGAGKSTLLGVLAGRVRITSGEVRLFGEPAPTGDPRRARRRGVAAIYQELTIVPAMSVLANVFLDTPLARAGWRRSAAMRAEFDDLAGQLGVRIDPDAIAGRLSVADQQLVEILRALRSRARLLLFDEPTASLAGAERAALYALIRRIRDQGVTVVLVSHNLDEVLRISDTVTVFRDGAVVATRAAKGWEKPALVQAMLGTRGVSTSGAIADRPTSERPVTVHMRLAGKRATPHGMDLRIRRGEVLGIAGLVGSGRSALLRELAGMQAGATGTITVDGVAHRMPRSVRESRRRGFAIVPEDRKALGLVPALPADRNVVLSDLGAVARWGVIGRAAVRRAATEPCAAFAFDRGRLGEPVRNLSGGNQQKALLARWLHSRPGVLLADEPTRGVDIGAKEQIMRALTGFARSGAAVVMVCSEIEQLLEYCDRVVVLVNGGIRTEFDLHTERVTEDDIVRAAFDVSPTNVAVPA